ncbi:MAG TPA: hypothetical protein VHY56_03895 [Candidatus Binataceae bacterium]|nr:hypothetical protein [Candidatus Binataceae bacterium]
MPEPTKDVQINGASYQIGRFTARDGSWILMQILTKMLPSAVANQLNGMGGLASGRSAMSEEEFASLQGHALAVCRRYENGVPMPVFLRPNTWAIKELEYDVVTVLGLTVNALAFNLSPFFKEGGLTQILASLQDSSQPASLN